MNEHQLLPCLIRGRMAHTGPTLARILLFSWLLAPTIAHSAAPLEDKELNALRVSCADLSESLRDNCTFDAGLEKYGDDFCSRFARALERKCSTKLSNDPSCPQTMANMEAKCLARQAWVRRDPSICARIAKIDASPVRTAQLNTCTKNATALALAPKFARVRSEAECAPLDDAMQQRCFRHLARNTGNVVFCLKVPELGRPTCVSGVAERTGSVEPCKALPESDRLLCLLAAAATTGEAAICDQIRSLRVENTFAPQASKEGAEDCSLAVALRKRDTSLCPSSVERAAPAKFCAAVVRKDYAACRSDTACINYVAQLNDDIEGCERVPQNKDRCVEEVAMRLQSEEPCSHSDRQADCRARVRYNNDAKDAL